MSLESKDCFIMRTISKLFVALFLLEFPVVASSRLNKRQERGFWPDIDFGALLGGAAVGVGGMIDGAVQYFQGSGDSEPGDSDSGNSDSSKQTPIPNTGSTSNTESPPVSPQAAPDSTPPDPSSSPKGAYNMEINDNLAPGMIHKTDPSEIGSGNCDPNNDNIADCENSSDQLVFTSSCENIDPNQVSIDAARTQNQAIKDILTEMVAQNTFTGIQGLGLRTSTSKRCDVLLFAVFLTPKQIKDVPKIPGVRAVVPNQAIELDEAPSGSDLEEEEPAEASIPTSSKRAQFGKREDIIRDNFAYEDLRLISTAPDMRLRNFYAYSSEAGDLVTIITIDCGVNLLHEEFASDSSLVEALLFGLDSDTLPDDYAGFGTCRTSKAGGPRYGVSKKAKLVVAKVAPSIGSLLDLLAKIDDYLIGKNDKGLRISGYHVLSLVAQWNNDDELASTIFEYWIDKLQQNFQLVVVVSAGMDRTKKNSDIVKWPATAERRHPIIVVGAIRVKSRSMYSWSRAGPFLSVLAPGRVKCARNAPGHSVVFKHGTDVAALQTASLVAYLLSHNNFGPYLRRNQAAIPSNVKDFIMNTASYVRRTGDTPSIWNLVDT